MRTQQPAPDRRQDPKLPPEPRPPRSFAGLYLASWAVLAALAAGYMTTVLLQPDWATPLTTQSLRTEPAPPPVPPVVQQLSAEVGSLRKTVADLQRELDHVKSATANQQQASDPFRAASQEPELAIIKPGLPVQMTLAESRPSSVDAKATEVDSTHAKPAAASAERTSREEAKAKPGAVPERPVEKKKVVVLNAQPADKPLETDPIETGSLPSFQPPAITFGPPVVTPAGEAVGIHLDAGPSLDALRLRWSVLHDRHASALRDLQPRYLISGTAASPSYQLMAGPISSAEEASRICALLRAKRVACSVGGPFVGQAL